MERKIKPTSTHRFQVAGYDGVVKQDNNSGSPAERAREWAKMFIERIWQEYMKSQMHNVPNQLPTLQELQNIFSNMMGCEDLVQSQRCEQSPLAEEFCISENFQKADCISNVISNTGLDLPPEIDRNLLKKKR